MESEKFPVEPEQDCQLDCAVKALDTLRNSGRAGQAATTPIGLLRRRPCTRSR